MTSPTPTASHPLSGTRIDTHAHYLGGSIGAMLRGPAAPKGGFKVGAWTPELALDFMDRHDIATQILSVPIDLTGKLPDDKLAAVGKINEELAEVVAAHPDRFGAFASLPLVNSDQALAELDHVLDDLGLDGVALESNSHGRYFGQPWIEPILAELGRRGTPTFVHPADAPGIDEVGFGRPSSVVEFPMDTARNIVNAIYNGVFLRNPGLQLILPHAGGVLPTLGWRISEHLANGRGPYDDTAVTKDHVEEVLRGIYYDVAIAPGPHSLLPLLASTTADHIVYGSDWPAAPEYAVVDADEEFNRFDGLTDAEKHAVGRTNALTLFPRFGTPS